MTTIACDRKSMSCDLQFSHGGEIKFKGKTKIITLSPKVASDIFGCEKCFVGFAGNAEIWGEIVSWFAVPDERLPKCKGIELLMLTDQGKIYHASNLRNWMEIDEPYFSIGSGMHLAIAAMATGKTTTEAVKIASKHDLNTGMGVKTFYL